MMTCGIWPTSCGLLARLVASDGRAHTPILLADNAARARLVDRLEDLYGPDWELVMSSRLAKTDPLTGIARRLHITVWVVPGLLLHALAFAKLQDATAVELLARLPRCPFLRRHLRRLPPTASRQLSLL